MKEIDDYSSLSKAIQRNLRDNRWRLVSVIRIFLSLKGEIMRRIISLLALSVFFTACSSEINGTTTAIPPTGTSLPTFTDTPIPTSTTMPTFEPTVTPTMAPSPPPEPTPTPEVEKELTRQELLELTSELTCVIRDTVCIASKVKPLPGDEDLMGIYAVFTGKFVEFPMENVQTGESMGTYTLGQIASRGPDGEPFTVNTLVQIDPLFDQGKNYFNGFENILSLIDGQGPLTELQPSKSVEQWERVLSRGQKIKFYFDKDGERDESGWFYYSDLWPENWSEDVVSLVENGYTDNEDLMLFPELFSTGGQ